MINPLNIFKIGDLRRRLLAIVGLLAVFRIMAAVPVPGVDVLRLEELLAGSQLLGFLNLFSGGGLSNLSIVMLGVGPYITATIIMQLLTIVFPNLKKLYFEEGEIGRAKFNRLSRLITVPLAAVQSYGFINFLNSRGVFFNLTPSTLLFDVLIVTAGSIALMWIGELITEYKFGNGVSLIILAGIVSGLPQAIQASFFSLQSGTLDPAAIIAFLVIALIVIGGVVFITEGERKIPVSYARRVRGNKLYGGVSTYLPLRVNQAGVIPIIFAISILLFPQFIAQAAVLISPAVSLVLNGWANAFFNNLLLYGLAYFVLVVVFTYFYTAVTFDPKEISKNLQQAGGFVPGLRPGDQTSSFLSKVINRTTLFGSLFLGAIAVLPLVVQGFFPNLSFLTIGGTSLLIVVSVALETMRQVESQLTIRAYD